MEMDSGGREFQSQGIVSEEAQRWDECLEFQISERFPNRGCLCGYNKVNKAENEM